MQTIGAPIQAALRNALFVERVRVDMVQNQDVLNDMEAWIKRREWGNYIVFLTANDFVLGVRSDGIREAVNQSSLTVPDGMSIVHLGRMHGYPLRERVYGPDFMLHFITQTESKNYSHFFYGGSQRALDRMIEKLQSLAPSIQIAGSYAPPFRELTEEEDEEIVEKINSAAPDVLWVALGGPKQQLWMHAHKKNIRVPVMAGVGQAFDLISREKPQAPPWMRISGLEWLFRLAAEPRRLWRRYLINNTLFCWYALKAVLRNQMKAKA